MTLPSGPVGIPGEPPHITGAVPIQRSATPSTRVAVTRADAPPPVRREDTPPAGQQRATPARGMQQGWGPSAALVGGLVAVALVVALVLWWTLATGDDDPVTSTTVLPQESAPAVADQDTASDLPAESTPVVPVASEPAAPPVAEGAQIVSIATFDPEGDGEENDDLVDAALADGDSTTEWRTSCYSNKFMGAKRGVGLVVSFDGPVEAPITFDVGSAPYQIQFYEWDGETPPGTVDDWGEPFDRSF